MYFCSETGLPVVELHSRTSGQSAGSGLLPDLLEEQQAQLQLTCDCGASSSHQATCSLNIKNGRAFPSSRVDLVVCPACGDKIPLSRPLVVHDEAQERLILRLPASFRMRANAVLSWWFDCLQRSDRPVIPGYARTPILEFFQAQPTTSSVKKPASISKVGTKKIVKSPPSSTNKEAPFFQPEIQNKESSSSSYGTGSPPLSEAQESNALLDSLDSSSFSPDQEHTSDNQDPSLLGNAKEESPETLFSTPAVADILPKSSPNIDVAPPKREIKQTLSFGALIKKPNKLSFGELPLDELSGEFNEYEDLDDGMPTLMVAVPEAPKPEEKKRSARHTMSLSSSPSVVVTENEELDMLHSEKEEEGTLISPEAIARANRGGPVLVKKGLAALGQHIGDPGATREAPAPILDVIEALDLGSDDAEATMQSRNVKPTPPEKDGHPARPSAEFNVANRKPPKEPLPEAPTVARRMTPESLSDIRTSQSRAATAIRNIVGNGMSASPEYEQHLPLRKNLLETWKNNQSSFYYETSLETQKCSVYFHFSQASSRLLEQDGEVSFSAQLHRLSSYPLLVLLFAFRDAHGEVVETLSCPLDVDHHNSLIFLDILMQDFALYCYLCEDDFSIYRDLQVQLPLEGNIEYLLEQARAWKSSISPSSRSFERAWKEFNTPGYDRLGKMEHNFSQDSFADIGTPAQAQLASGIVSYWSEPEQLDYLVTMKSFPIVHFTAVQRRTIEGCILFGIHMPEHLRQLALEFKLAKSQQELLQRLVSGFAETNLAIRQPNNLDPWDNLANWQKLLDSCDEYHVEVDEDIEELAELAQRRCQSDSENTHNIDDEDIVEIDGFSDMDPRELVELLQDPVHGFDAAMALCDTQESQFIDYVAGVFANLEREEAISLAEAFTQFGGEAEPLLISWLHLPRPYHREAAMLALGTITSVQAIDEIIKRLRSGEEWETAAEALGRIGEPALSSLAQEIKNKNWLIRLRAVKALQKIHSDQTLALFEQLRSDPNEVVKAEVAAILNG